MIQLCSSPFPSSVLLPLPLPFASAAFLTPRISSVHANEKEFFYFLTILSNSYIYTGTYIK